MNTYDQENYLTQIHGHLLLSIHADNELKELTAEELTVAKNQSALNHIRHCSESIIHYIILESVTTGISNWMGKRLHEKIEELHIANYFDSDNNKNDIKRWEFHKLRFGGNTGSHTSANKNKNPDYNDYQVCLNVLKDIFKWFCNKYSLLPSDSIKAALENSNVNAADLPKFDDWFLIASQYENFKARNTQYVLINAPGFNRSLSVSQVRDFIKADVDWHLIIDFDENSRSSDNGLCKHFNDQFGIENIRVYTSDTENSKIDFTESPMYPLTFLYLAQDSKPVRNIKKWKKIHENKLKGVITKSRAKSNHSNLVVVSLSEDPVFLEVIMDFFSNAYGQEADKIDFAFITNQVRVREQIKEKIKEYEEPGEEIFNSIKHYLIDHNEFVRGISLSQKSDLDNNASVTIPAYTSEQADTQVELSEREYLEFKKTKFMDVIHKDIGKQADANYNRDDFYRGDEITWRGIAHQRGKGIDIIRSKIHVIEQDIRTLLSAVKHFRRFELYHEPSAGGTTIAKRIAYQIGTEDYPTVIIHRFHRIETFSGINKLYALTGDKPILMIVEEAFVGLQEFIELENRLKGTFKKIVAVYVRRSINNIKDKRQERRGITATLDDDEIRDFEEVFCREKPTRKHELKQIAQLYKKQKEFITPFIYGLTAYEKNFLKLEDYVKQVLINTNAEVKETLCYICLIGKYTNVPVPESSFYSLLGFTNPLEENLAVQKFLRKSIKNRNAWEIRHILLANEVCEQILGGENLEKKHTWRSALKNWLFRLMDIFKKNNPDGLDDDSQEKELLEAIFINKTVSTDINAKEKFSKLITEINDNPYEGVGLSIQILKKLSEKFPEHAFFHQHLSRLYLHSARQQNKLHYDSAVDTAQKAIELAPSISSVYHTKGDAIVRKLQYFNNDYNRIIDTEDELEFEEKIMEYYKEAEYNIKKCIEIDIESTYGYTSYIYLIIYILEIGFKLSKYTSLQSFIKDVRYEWFAEKVPLGLDLVERLKAIYHYSIKENEEMIEQTERSFEKLSNYLRQKSASYYEKQELDTQSDSLKFFYRNAYIRSSLSNLDFKEPHKAWMQLGQEQLDKVLNKLKKNLRYTLTFRDLRNYLNAIKNKNYAGNLTDTIDFLEELYDKEIKDPENKEFFVLGDIAYYLYVMCAIQDITNSSIDNVYFDKAQMYLTACKQYNRIVKNDKFEFEWLGNEQGIGELAKMVNRRDLGEFKTNEFTRDTSKLREVKGKIVSVGHESFAGDRGSERKNGKIEFNEKITGKSCTAYFIPIKGGIIEGQTKPCTFDDRKYENNQEVSFFLGFSYSGYRAWQPIPASKVRANLKNIKVEGGHQPRVVTLSSNSAYEMKVRTVNKKLRRIEGTVKGVKNMIIIPFEEGKSYQDYKHLRRERVEVTYDGESFNLVKGRI